jgi:NTP pyrophosphatase (non-canonical NTP hydrolase)
MTYYLYHIPGKKIGITKDLKKRVEEQQGYYEGEYDVILQTDDINIISEAEISLQKAFGYRVDEEPYNELKFNNTNMNINVTEQTTTFPCPVSKLKGQLMDNVGMKWETEHGDLHISPKTIDWIMDNVQTSRYNPRRCYVYNKAFARFYDNHDVYAEHEATLADLHMQDQYNGKTRTGGLLSDNEPSLGLNDFDLIRMWANQRGLYENGDTKTQALKLVEEVGETCRAILKEDHDEVVDGIGDCVVVLTNLAELQGVTIEECIKAAYKEICNRTGKMVNGTFKKD